MRPARKPHAPRVLLIEPSSTVRGTLASACRDLGLAKVQQASSLAQGEQSLRMVEYQGLLVSVELEGCVIEFLNRLRSGGFASGPEVAVVLMSQCCTSDFAHQAKALGVRRILLQPFKLRDVVHTLEQLWSVEGPEPEPEPEMDALTHFVESVEHTSVSSAG